MMVDNIQKYAIKVEEETKKIKKISLIVIIISVIISFSFGVYFSYVAIDNTLVHNSRISKFNNIYQTILDEWYYGIEDDNLDETMITNAIYGMLDNDGDMFTRYITSIDYLQEKAVGIGISVMEYKEYFYITDVVSKSSLSRDIQVGDILKKIDGEDLKYKSMEVLTSLIKDKEEVTLTIERNNVDIEKLVPILLYETVTVFSDNTFSEDTYYLKIKEFGNNTASELKVKLQENNKSKIILDLRDNPGGYINSVVDVANLFLERNKVVLETKNNKEQSIKYKTKSNEKFDFDKMIILINENSASGAEALSAALNEHLNDKVILIGQTTYGKGSAQKTISLGDGTYLAYTYALWFTPEGNSIHHLGVDAEVEYLHDGLFTYEFYKNYLEKDDLGDGVKNLQLILSKMGYHGDDWEYFGYYSQEVIDAVKLYQNDEAITQTGKLDEITFRHLIGSIQDSKKTSYEIELQYIIDNFDVIGIN